MALYKEKFSPEVISALLNKGIRLSHLDVAYAANRFSPHHLQELYKLMKKCKLTQLAPIFNARFILGKTNDDLFNRQANSLLNIVDETNGNGFFFYKVYGVVTDLNFRNIIRYTDINDLLIGGFNPFTQNASGESVQRLLLSSADTACHDLLAKILNLHITEPKNINSNFLREFFTGMNIEFMTRLYQSVLFNISEYIPVNVAIWQKLLLFMASTQNQNIAALINADFIKLCNHEKINLSWLAANEEVITKAKNGDKVIASKSTSTSTSTSTSSSDAPTLSQALR